MELKSEFLTVDIGVDSKTDKLARLKPASGTLTKPNEVDNFLVSAKKDDTLLVKIEAAGLGFPTDSVLRILKPDGSELKLVDDSNKESDFEYLWKVAADGEYRIEVTDRFRQGGPLFRYRVSIDKPEPIFSATIEKSEYVLEQGKSLDIKVKVTRLHGHKADLAFEIPDLPEKVEFTAPDKVPEKGGDITLKLEAKEGASSVQKEINVNVFEQGRGR